VNECLVNYYYCYYEYEYTKPAVARNRVRYTGYRILFETNRGTRFVHAKEIRWSLTTSCRRVSSRSTFALLLYDVRRAVFEKRSVFRFSFPPSTAPIEGYPKTKTAGRLEYGTAHGRQKLYLSGLNSTFISKVSFYVEIGLKSTLRVR